MVKVIVERHLKEGESLMHLLRELRAAALCHPGYITGETLVSTEDKSAITVISTWRSLEDWQSWAATEMRTRLYQQIRPLLAEEPKVRTYQIAATEETKG